MRINAKFLIGGGDSDTKAQKHGRSEKWIQQRLMGQEIAKIKMQNAKLWYP
jgi:hypothetical protein